MERQCNTFFLCCLILTAFVSTIIKKIKILTAYEIIFYGLNFYQLLLIQISRKFPANIINGNNIEFILSIFSSLFILLYVGILYFSVCHLLIYIQFDIIILSSSFMELNIFFLFLMLLIFIFNTCCSNFYFLKFYSI